MRLELQHTLFLLTFGDQLHCAPLDKQAPQVLDAGCGTGVWSIELGIPPGRFSWTRSKRMLTIPQPTSAQMRR